MPSYRGAFSKFQAASKPEPNDPPTSASGSRAAASAPPPPIKRSHLPKTLQALSVEESKSLLEALRTAVASDAFQKALTNLQNRDWGAFKKRGAMAKLLSLAWKEPLKAGGLGVNAQTFPSMLASVRLHAEQPGIRTLATEVERLLRFFPGALFGSNAGAMKGGTGSQEFQFSTVSGRRAFSQMMSPGAAPVVEAAAEETPVKLLRDRAMNLGESKEILKVLKEVCSSRDFQEGLAHNLRKHPQQAHRAAARFIGQAWAGTLSMFDFPRSPEAFKELAAGINKQGWNLHVKMMAHEVESLLGVPLGSFFGIAPNEGQEEQEEDEDGSDRKEDPTPPPGAVGKKIVQVNVRHAVEGLELQVTVPVSATFWAVKEAISSLTGRQDILTKGKLVKQSQNGMYSAYRDNDHIEHLRDLLVLGADLRLEKSNSPSSDVGSAAGKGKIRFKLAPQDLGASYSESTPGNVGVDTRAASQASQYANMRHKAQLDAIPSKEAEVPTLSKQEAMDVQKALFRGFSSPTFQQRLQQIEDEFDDKDKFIEERNKHFLTVQSVVLPKFGFEPSERGVLKMLGAFAPWNADAQIQHMSMQINRLLRMDRPIATTKGKAKANPVVQKAEAKPTSAPQRAVAGNPQEPAEPAKVPKPAEPVKPAKPLMTPPKLGPELVAALVHSAKMKKACPDERPDDETTCKIWIVVGGEHSGGILVRKGAELESTKLPSRLVYGARVEELDIEGNRLHYKRLHGDGPDIGWVNIKSHASKNPDGALVMLLGDLELAQRKQNAALEKEEKNFGEFQERQEEQRKAEVEAQSKSALRGSEQSTSSQETQSISGTAIRSPLTQRQPVNQITAPRAADRMPTNVIADSAVKLDARRTDSKTTVPVLIRHATRHEEVNITVPANATIKDVKDVLLRGAQAADPSKVRLARRFLNSFTYMDDSSPLGEIRDLVVMGMSFKGYRHDSVEPVSLPSFEEFETQQEELETSITNSAELGTQFAQEQQESDSLGSVQSRRQAIERLASLSQQDRRGALNQVAAAAQGGAKVIWGKVAG